MDIASYLDNITPNNASLFQKLAINDCEERYILFKWFNNNYMKVNSDKSHLLISWNIWKVLTIIDNNCIQSEDTHELLVITIDSKLTFATHNIKLCKKASQNLSDLPQISYYMTIDKVIWPLIEFLIILP